MQYYIATVTDDTPETLEYGDYRGLVVIDAETGRVLDDGHDFAHPESLDEARSWIARDAKVMADQVQIIPDESHSDEYGDRWLVLVEH